MINDTTRSVSITETSTGAQLAVFSLRQWQIDRGERDALKTVLSPFYRRLGVEEALNAFLTLMSQFDRYGDNPIVFNCPCQELLHENERLFLDWLLASGESNTLNDALKKKAQIRNLAKPAAVTFAKMLSLGGLAIGLPPNAGSASAVAERATRTTYA